MRYVSSTEIEIIDRLFEEYQVNKSRLEEDLTEFMSEDKRERLFN